MRLIAWLSLAGVAAAAAACTKEPVSVPELWRLRNTGRLQAARDVQEGYDAAAKAFASLRELRTDPLDLLNLARVQVLGLHFDEAAASLVRARSAWPNPEQLPLDFAYLDGLALKGQSKNKEAAERFREVTIRDPALEAGWFQLGTALGYAQAYPDAVEAFEKLLELNPRHLAAHYKRSMALRMMKESAKADEALARFNELKAAAGDAATADSAYERCRYTRVTLVPPPLAAPGASVINPPSFEDLTSRAGLSELKAVGAAVLDYDRDGDPDLYLVRGGPNQLLRNDEGRWVDASDVTDAADPGEGVAAEPADFNNDGLVDIFLINRKPSSGLLKGLGEGAFQPMPKSGLALEGVETAVWADYDHDGDLDLITLEAIATATAVKPVAGASAGFAPVIHRNNGDETFLRQEGLLGGPVSSGSIALGDFDRGNDIDFVLGSGEGPAVLCMNLRKGPFRCVPLEDFRGHAIVDCADLDNDGEMDLVGSASSTVSLEWARSGGPRALGEAPKFSRQQLCPGAPAGATVALAMADLDNDGSLEAVCAGPAALTVISQAAKPGGGISTPIPSSQSLTSLTVVDFDGNGALDLLGTGPEGRLALLGNTCRAFPSVVIRLTGSRDNKDGIGAHVELFAGLRYQRRLLVASSSAGGSSSVRFGLGELPVEKLDGFEILWPNGISQPVLPAELKWGKGNRLEVTQKRGLTVSCPFLFVDDGTGYKFQTDVIGIAPLDEWLPDGAKPHLDPEELVRIPGNRLKPVQGRLRVAISEELRETTYLDRLRLLRVTHPVGTTLLGDETTQQGDFDPLRVWILPEGALRPPAAVRSSRGARLDDEIREADGRYAHPADDSASGSQSQWAGWVPEHALEIEPPMDGLQTGSLLLLQGRIYWPDSSVTFALSQHGRAWIPPRLEAVFTDGSSAILIPDIGFPCGMDRTMVLPLVLPLDLSAVREVRALRLVTNHRFLWDRISFATAARIELGAPGEHEAQLSGVRVRLRLEELPMTAARLGFHGFSRVVGDLERHEQTYDFADTTPALAFQYPRGRATPYGDVRELVQEPDSRLVVIPPGDALFSEFEVGADPVGVTVTYFLQVTGWAKESNFHNATGRFLAPLPFHGMEGYPPAKAARVSSPLTRAVGED